MKIIIIILPLFIAISLSAQTIQKVVSGKIEHIENFQSQFVESRNIDIWLPAEYEGKKKFAVLYMHDGQMLFDSSSTWNHQSWNVDDIAAKLIEEKLAYRELTANLRIYQNFEVLKFSNFEITPFEDK